MIGFVIAAVLLAAAYPFLAWKPAPGRPAAAPRNLTWPERALIAIASYGAVLAIGSLLHGSEREAVVIGAVSAVFYAASLAVPCIVARRR